MEKMWERDLPPRLPTIFGMESECGLPSKFKLWSPLLLPLPLPLPSLVPPPPAAVPFPMVPLPYEAPSAPLRPPQLVEETPSLVKALEVVVLSVVPATGVGLDPFCVVAGTWVPSVKAGLRPEPAPAVGCGPDAAPVVDFWTATGAVLPGLFCELPFPPAVSVRVLA